MNKKIYIPLSLLALLTVSCASDEPGSAVLPEHSPLSVYADISGSAKTRVVRWEVQDEWSFEDFTSGDVMGFYSAGGNWSVDNGRGGFTNQALVYDGKQFTDPDGIDFSPSHMESSSIFMYYPYSPVMDTQGISVRDNSVNPPRCIDLLSSSELTIQGVQDNKKVALFGQFGHSFSELIIMRGKGFDSPPSGMERITVVMRDPVTNLRLEVSDDPWGCVPEMVYDPNSGLTPAQASRYDAWKGGNYGITSQDPIGVPAWYVIVPTIGSKEPKVKPGDRSYVEYIELYDNEGHLQRVSSLRLSGGNSKFVDAGWRYPMEITMEELVPTVNPFVIIPWNDTIDLTDERTRGINNITEFARWVYDYNAYLIDSDNPDKISALLQYGDLYQDTEGKKSWHFYILSDLDFTNYRPYTGSVDGGSGDGGDQSETYTVILPVLNDILDGISTTLSNGKFINHTITGLTTTFIGSLSGKDASVINIDFDGPEVKNPETSTTPAGIIANNMVNSSVVNCRILDGDLLNPGGPAGMVVGDMTGGMVKDCVLRGFMVASSTATGDGARIAGITTPDSYFTGNQVSVSY